MKNNKLMKLFLSFLMVLTISCTNANLITEVTLDNYDSQVEFFNQNQNKNEDGEKSPLINYINE